MGNLKSYLVLVVIVVSVAMLMLFFLNRSGRSKSGPESAPLTVRPDYASSRYKEIYLAGGCFWGVEAYLSRIDGIEYTGVGYANGKSDKTDYDSIKSTGHAETVYVAYDPERLGLDELLGYFYGIIEPTSLNQQGNDVGPQYRTGIYYVDEGDRATIEAATAREQAKHSGKIVTEIEPLRNYITAEDYHQDYLDKNPYGYCHISLSSIPREVPRISASEYPKPTQQELKSRLTPSQYSITQESGTEPAFQNEYWDNEAVGLYVDVVTGEPLFLSRHKFDSGTGWPSFTRPIQWDVVTYVADTSLGMTRVEVSSRSGGTHLGHLFDDGPAREGGLRYCMNSGALRFIPVDQMDAEGYGRFTMLVQ